VEISCDLHTRSTKRRTVERTGIEILEQASVGKERRHAFSQEVGYEQKEQPRYTDDLRLEAIESFMSMIARQLPGNALVNLRQYATKR